MTRPGNYASPIAFQAAIEDRIRRVVRETGRSHHSIRQRLLFERVLERVHLALNDSFILKGELALELRIDEARTTRDVDLRVEGELSVALAKIRASFAAGYTESAIELPERFLSFVAVAERPLDVVREYAAIRLDVEARLGGKPYGGRFHIDIATGDILTGEPDVLDRPSFLAFAGARNMQYRLYPIVTHLAEKIHALTLPRQNDNSRLKDLVDIALLLEFDIDQDALITGLQRTFHHRGTHDIPARLPPFPESWALRYPNERRRDFPWIQWRTFDEVATRVRATDDGILSHTRARASPCMQSRLVLELTDTLAAVERRTRGHMRRPQLRHAQVRSRSAKSL